MEISETNPFDGDSPSAKPQAVEANPAANADFGTLGPNPDVTARGLEASAEPEARQSLFLRRIPLMAAFLGVFFGVLAINVGKAHASWDEVARFLWHGSFSAPRPAAEDFSEIDGMVPQKQAEMLLELAIGNTAGATQQIERRAEGWRGKLTWSSQIADLTSAALNANDPQVREAGVEVEIAAYGLARNPATVELLAEQAKSSSHSQKIWALWGLGLMANRGVASGHAVEALQAHLQDADEDSRRWAVEGLALAGTTATVPVLLKTMHDDSSPLVRERAACSLAASGMLTREQRLTAVPTLVNFSDDPALDSQTHTWVFQALGEITGQRLPNDAAAWRSWYAANASSSN